MIPKSSRQQRLQLLTHLFTTVIDRTTDDGPWQMMKHHGIRNLFEFLNLRESVLDMHYPYTDPLTGDRRLVWLKESERQSITILQQLVAQEGCYADWLTFDNDDFLAFQQQVGLTSRQQAPPTPTKPM